MVQVCLGVSVKRACPRSQTQRTFSAVPNVPCARE